MESRSEVIEVKNKARVGVAYILGVILTVFVVFTAGFGSYSLPIQRGVPLLIAFSIIFITHPILKNPITSSPVRYLLQGVNLLFLIGNLASILYIIFFENEITTRLGAPSTLDIVACSVGFLCVIEAARRATPTPFFSIILVFICYALFGNYIPGNFGHAGYEIGDLITYLYYSNEGIFGVHLNVMVNIIYIFLLFGTFVEASDLGKSIINIGISLLGRLRGGPALAAVFASGAFGSISGSGASNVFTTGTFTIPLMQKIGYSRNFAGAVEAVASTGGHVVPPVMGVAVFIMAELVGMPYIAVCAAAAIPAFLYYLCLLIIVYLQACKQGLQPVPEKDRPSVKEAVRQGGFFFLPVVLLIALLIRGFTPGYACFYAISLFTVLLFIKKHSKKDIKDFVDICDRTANRSLMLFACLSSIGIVVGVVALTGIGIKFSILIAGLAANNLFLALLMAMMATIVLSMGMPATPAYLLVIVVSGMALQKLGLAALTAHLFIYYFASLAGITPPVSIVSYSAAGISGGDPIKTGFIALRLGIIGFILPYMFAFAPSLLLIGSFNEIFWSVITAIIGIICFSVGMEGYLNKNINYIQRGLFIIAGLLLASPGIMLGFVGAGLMSLCAISTLVKNPLATN